MDRHPRGVTLRAFTLIEMVVVVAVVLILLGIILPSASALWAERKRADAANILQGVLRTTRARAMQARGAETGLFFFVDDEGVQRIAPIEQVQPDPLIDPSRLASQNAFRITEDRDHPLPAPMRLLPRYLVEPDLATPADDPVTFNDAELLRDDRLPAGQLTVYVRDQGIDEAQRHRNFFTMIYSSAGRLLVWRDVLIQDADQDGAGALAGNGVGDRTGLQVGDQTGALPDVQEYYDQDGAAVALDPRPGGAGRVTNLITEPGAPPVAINFPSVDGVLLYDDSLLRTLPTGPQRRDFLLRTAQPYYVHHSTGMLIKGPVGERP